MKKSDFYYDLPEELIAQVPLQDRTASRLLVLNKESGEIQHRHFRDILEYLQPGDCMILECRRKVMPARLLVQAERNLAGTHVELLLLKRCPEGMYGDGMCWEASGTSGTESTSRTSSELWRRDAGGRGPGNRRGRQPNRTI